MAQPPATENPFAIWVRSWVHYDNLSNNYGKQAIGAKKLRDEFETKIIQNLRANHMEKATIQVSGAKLTLVEERCPPSLSISRLESYLHSYFQQKGNHVDETDSILRYIKLQKNTQTIPVVKLKKTLQTYSNSQFG